MNLYFKILLAALALTIFASSCRDTEDLPPTVTGTPVFTVQATLDGDVLKMTAGDGYFMNTDYRTDSLDILTFLGEFEEAGCDNQCQGRLAFEFRDFQPEGTAPFEVTNSILQNFPYPYASTEVIVDSVISAYEVSFENKSFLQPGAFVEWTIFADSNAVTTLAGTNPVQVFDGSETVNVCLQVFTNTLSECQKCRTIGLSNILISEDCQVFLKPHFDSMTQMLTLTAETTGNEPFTVFWDTGFIGDSICLPPGGPSMPFDICVTIVTADGCTDFTCLSIQNSTGTSEPQICYSDFTYEVSPIFEDSLIFDPLQLGTVAIEYEDEDGNLYRSDVMDQDPNNWFEVASIVPYEKNDEGQSTVKLEVNFNCRLYKIDNPSISKFLTGEAVIGVAHPDN